MLLALKKTPASDATRLDRLTSWVIKMRLVSQYSHGGVVVDGHLYQSNSSHGLHEIRAGEWSPERWDLFEVPGDDASVLSAYARLKGADYDWWSLLAFVGLRIRDASRLYCFEWCWIAQTGLSPTGRITPEMLLSDQLQRSQARQAA